MAILKCPRCNNMVLSPPNNMGDRCSKDGCWGTFSFFANTIVIPPKQMKLKCLLCGNVYLSSPKRKMFEKCGVNDCEGRLDRFYG